ncbi:carboxyltransferase domain-containing protein [Paenarthrobacter sp. NPDC056912]|uniref:carboxyltransferase domain-containing protein n=1 Tax=Paenarthrobacter sp. NPDC056912 TaxID=3345965 RepID=UPI003671C594
MTATTGITFLSAPPGKLLMRVVDREKSDRYIGAFRDMVDSLCLPGLMSVHSLKNGFHVSYDVRIIEAGDLRDVLAAVDVAVRFAHGNHSPRTHRLSVAFRGPASIDLSVASLMLGTTESGLVRRLCRTTHLVAGLAPGASAAPLIQMTLSGEIPPGVQMCRPRRAVTPGTLLLSDAGVTVASQSCFSNELQIGRLTPPQSPSPGRLHVGDFVRFQQNTRPVGSP